MSRCSEKKHIVAVPSPLDRLYLGRSHAREVDASHFGTGRSERYNIEIEHRGPGRSVRKFATTYKDIGPLIAKVSQEDAMLIRRHATIASQPILISKKGKPRNG